MLLAAWPRTRLFIFTSTPCGGEFPGPALTPKEACHWFSVVNDAYRRVVARHAPRHRAGRVQILDAHQMAVSHPYAEKAGTPPGLWMDQRHGVHFALATNPKARWKARRAGLADGEMNRAMANRVLDAVCPELGDHALPDPPWVSTTSRAWCPRCMWWGKGSYDRPPKG